ncbi:hypothetical protein GCM10025865_17320 [Paraoerskovia sediminicola]|uniref:MORN repeat variant n=1 Tax=Paraoerskovia sediminicola TaxID=1138587 RepID=A0ABN6XBT1_9CELL|nr:hypothetical protein [Paraoerskovia sediminicola]BDZ42433.1 hypothetical protein GCM10025865_17320 [Paraoerskovia sediminicola]
MSTTNPTPHCPDPAHEPGAPPATEVHEHVERHKDGTVRGRGPMLGTVPQGYWEWFRLDGTMMRSGTLRDGEQVGEWTTYDRQGVPYKTTDKGGSDS